MREIKFRGKLRFGGKWVYGSLVCNNAQYSGGDIYSYKEGEWDGPLIVDSNTVGQYTGLHDKNGVEIYEGDILQGSDTSPKYVVVFERGAWQFTWKWRGNSGAFPLYERSHLLDVVGNIHDNLELLEGEQ